MQKQNANGREILRGRSILAWGGRQVRKIKKKSMRKKKKRERESGPGKEAFTRKCTRGISEEGKKRSRRPRETTKRKGRKEKREIGAKEYGWR